jgi:hypothetical protein
VTTNEQEERPALPPPPRTVEGLMQEMYGVFDSCFALYQGMMRYWLMWRLPQIVDTIRGTPGLKFHFCATYRGLLDNFLRIFLLPDLVVIGQCGHVLQHEMLQYEHPFDRPWPNMDGTHPALAAIGGKPDRPIVDGVLQFLYEWVRPLSSSGRVLFAPFTTMLAGPTADSLVPSAIMALLQDAIAVARPDGLPGVTIRDRMDAARELFRSNPEIKSVPLGPPKDSPEDQLLKALWDPGRMELKYGRYFWPDQAISQPDPAWGPEEIVAFEFFMATHLGCMLLVAGDWCDSVPVPAHSLNLRIPYVDGLSAPLLARAIANEPADFQEFQTAITNALTQALDARGSEAFSKELGRIQREIIDDAVARLDRKWKEIAHKRLARLGQYAVCSIGVTVGLHFAFSPAALAGLIFTSGASLLQEIEKRIGETAALKDNPMYFIWKLGR